MSHEHAAQVIHEAIVAKDVNILIEEIAKYENEDLQFIAAEYVKLFKTALQEEVKTVAHGEFGVFLVNLLLPRAVFAARVIRNAVEGAGTDENAIIDVIVHISNAEIDAIKQAYSTLFMEDLVKRISSDTSGHFRAAIVSVLAGDRDAGYGNPESEAETLYKKGEGKWGTDDDYFVNFFTKKSFETLLAIDVAYKNKYGHSLEVAVKKETSGAYQDLLVALAIPREIYWSRRIRHAIAGLGTDDVLLRRSFGLNSKRELQKVKAVYESVNKGKHLDSDVRDDTSGLYQKLYLSILKDL